MVLELTGTLSDLHSVVGELLESRPVSVDSQLTSTLAHYVYRQFVCHGLITHH